MWPTLEANDLMLQRRLDAYRIGRKYKEEGRWKDNFALPHRRVMEAPDDYLGSEDSLRPQTLSEGEINYLSNVRNRLRKRSSVRDQDSITPLELLANAAELMRPRTTLQDLGYHPKNKHSRRQRHRGGHWARIHEHRFGNGHRHSHNTGRHGARKEKHIKYIGGGLPYALDEATSAAHK